MTENVRLFDFPVTSPGQKALALRETVIDFKEEPLSTPAQGPLVRMERYTLSSNVLVCLVITSYIDSRA